jgi:hypothetical protein
VSNLHAFPWAGTGKVRAEFNGDKVTQNGGGGVIGAPSL